MWKRVLVAVHVGSILARNFEVPATWFDGDEFAPNIDEYNASEDVDTYDEFINNANNNESTVSTTTNITDNFTFIRELRNATRNAGDNAKLICEIESESLQTEVRWFKNEAPIVIKRKSRVTLKNAKKKSKKTYVSRLRITNLEVHDSGFYKCVFTNTIHQSISSTGVLNVKPIMGININLEGLDLEPSIPNFENVLKISNTKFLNRNFNMHPMNSDLSDDAISRIPICEPYRGTRCRKFLDNENVFIRPNISQTIIEDQLTEAFKVISYFSQVSEHCASYALPTLCHSALPICKMEVLLTHQLICREDCEILENDICKLEYAFTKRHAVIAEALNFEDCSKLPSDNCRKIGLPLPEPSDKSEICYRGDGKHYRGEVSQTISNKTCIPWRYQSLIRTAKHPELLGGHNFCRNPVNPARNKPWCFSSENTPELCNIPECEDSIYQSSLVAAIGIVTLLFFVLYYFYFSRNEKPKVKEPMFFSKYEISPGKSGIIKTKPEDQRSNSGSHREMSSLIPDSTNSIQKSEPKLMAFYHENIKLEEELGEGAFGKVYRGRVLMANGETMLVAIKTLKENSNSKIVTEFIREVELMSELRHPNIISLLGVCMTNRLCMLFEFIPHGDLHEYLITHSPNEGVPLSRNCTESIFRQDDQMNIAIQVAAGMNYLSCHHFVHRDLATRNCLVGENLVVKISDFGLSRDVYSSDYYRVQKSALLPIRWMSPESILSGKFTVESDIWSFGVVLWEIYSFGLQPYYAHNNADVVDMIRSLQVLSSPEGCPSRMYALMIECWNQVPNRRPRFTEIHSRLIEWRDTCNSSDRTDSTQLSHYPSNKTHHFDQVHRYQK